MRCLRQSSRWWRRTVLASVSLLASAACDGAGGDAELFDASVAPDASRLDAHVDLPEAGPLPDAHVGTSDGDGNSSFATAIPVRVGETVSGELPDDDDRDYVAVQAGAGQHIAVLLRGGAVEQGVELRLKDADGNLLGSGSSGLNCVEAPTHELVEVVFYAHEAATYYVELQYAQGWFDPSDLPGLPQPSDAWTVQALDLATVPTALVLSEGTEAELSSDQRCVVGVLEDEEDVDGFAVRLPAYRALHPEYNAPLALELKDGSGARHGRGSGWPLAIDDLADPVVEVRGWGLEAANVGYVLRVGPIFGGGADPSYVESADAANDAAATPEVLPAFSGSDELVWVAHVGAEDVDHFAIDVSTATWLSGECAGQLLGSSTAPVLELVSGETVLATWDMEGTPGEPVEAAPGRYLLRVSAQWTEPDVVGTLVACRVSLVGGPGGGTGGGMMM